jgi:hypothetical protein
LASAEVGSIRPAMMRSSVDLPEPERPSRPTISPARSVRFDVVEHQQLALAAAVLDGESPTGAAADIDRRRSAAW